LVAIRSMKALYKCSPFIIYLASIDPSSGNRGYSHNWGVFLPTKSREICDTLKSSPVHWGQHNKGIMNLQWKNGSL